MTREKSEKLCNTNNLYKEIWLFKPTFLWIIHHLRFFNKFEISIFFFRSQRLIPYLSEIYSMVLSWNLIVKFVYELRNNWLLTNLLIRFKMYFIFLFYSLPSNSRFKYSYWFLGRALINMKFNVIPWPSKSLRFLTYHRFVKFYKRLLFWMKSNCKLKIQKQKLEKNLTECKIQNHSKRTRKGLNTRKK